MEEYINEPKLDITGEFEDISHFKTKHIFCQHNNNLRLSYLPECLETISCERYCFIPYEEGNHKFLPNCTGFTDAYKTIVESWEYLFTICPNIEILEMRQRDVPGEVLMLKNLKEVYIEDAPSSKRQILPDGCMLILSTCGKPPAKYISKGGQIVSVDSKEEVKVFFTDTLHTENMPTEGMPEPAI